MVELTLPKNSKIQQGKTWPKPDGATNLCEYPAKIAPKARVY